MNLPKPIEEFVKLFSSFPSIGRRQATRLAFYLVNRKDRATEIIKVVDRMNKEISICQECFMPFYNPKRNEKLCPICSSQRRNRNIICVVEKETDLLTIENSHQYNGLYHVLGGTISPINPESYKKLRVDSLIERIKKNKVKEVVIAMNLTTAGELTSMYLEKALKDLKIKISRLGRGLPTGGEIEFADPETIASALKRREKD